METSTIRGFYVYCVVQPVVSDEVYEKFINSDDVKKNNKIIFITRDRFSNKILIGISERIKPKFEKFNFVIVPRHYHKATIDISNLDFNAIKDFIIVKFNASFIAIKNNICYFNIKDKVIYKSIIDKSDIYKFNDQPLEIQTVHSEKKEFKPHTVYEFIIKSYANYEDYDMTDIIQSLGMQNVITISRISTVDYKYRSFYRIKTTDKEVIDFIKENHKFEITTSNNKKIVFDLHYMHKDIKINKNNRNYNKTKKSGFVPPSVQQNNGYHRGRYTRRPKTYFKNNQ